MEKYINYVKNFQCSNLVEVEKWIKVNLNNYLVKNTECQNDIEHILDYLCSKSAPKRINKMSYDEAKSNSDKWLKSLIKTNNQIIETEFDTKIVLELDGGFKWVQLISEISYKNEGIRMRHCVGSYFGKNVKIYSLRDKNNEPHCTIESDTQIKGKGNGNISPNYIGYVVSFLEHLGMNVSDNEMKNLGYFNCTQFESDLHDDSLKLKYKNYLPISSNLKDKSGEKFFDLDFITILGLIDDSGKILVDLKLLDYGIKRLISQMSEPSSGNYAKNANSGDYAQNASSGDYAQNASSGDYARNASSGDYAQWTITGNKNVVASIGYKDKVKGVIDTWVTLAQYIEMDNKYEVDLVVSKKIDGLILKENVYYTLINGEFTQVD
jgi:hypothetical protein